MKRVLITGAEGNIGSRLRAALADQYDVGAIVRAPVSGLDAHVADIADLAAIRPAFDGVDAVVHLAASAAVESPWDEVLPNNLVGTYNVVEAARQAGARQIVFASSNHAVGMYELDGVGELYSARSGVMVREDAPVRPDSLYGVSKAYGEALARYYSEQHGMSCYCLRIGAIRPDDDPRGPSVPVDGPPWLPGMTRDRWLARMAAVWMSHADFAGLVDACLRAEHIRFGTYYGVSDNPYRFWSLEAAHADLGWRPRDAAPEPGS